MSRSGSSAVARVMALSGGALPKKLLGGNESNPTGHWEPAEALKLNDAFLHAHSSAWFDPSLTLQQPDAIDAAERETFVAQIGRLLANWRQGQPLVVKEPRITALAEHWLEAARRGGFAVAAIIPVRHPEEVAESLIRRDGMSRELATVLWLKCNLLAERQSRPLLRVFVTYNSLLEDWRAQLPRIFRNLALPLDGTIDAGAIDSFLRRDLRHHHRESDDVPARTGYLGLAGEVYRLLRAAAKDAPLDTRTLDYAFAYFEDLGRTVRSGWMEYRNRFGPPAEH